MTPRTPPRCSRSGRNWLSSGNYHSRLADAPSCPSRALTVISVNTSTFGLAVTRQRAVLGFSDSGSRFRQLVAFCPAVVGSEPRAPRSGTAKGSLVTMPQVETYQAKISHVLTNFVFYTWPNISSMPDFEFIRWANSACAAVSAVAPRVSRKSVTDRGRSSI
jgi:hypothetical protein